jgi:hypothetical protein
LLLEGSEPEDDPADEESMLTEPLEDAPTACVLLLVAMDPDAPPLVDDPSGAAPLFPVSPLDELVSYATLPDEDA